MDKAFSKLDRAEQAGHAKIARRAQREREKLDQVPQPTPQASSAHRRLDD
jgi:hypothetical protein